MNAKTIASAIAAVLAACTIGAASAKLPPPTQAQKAKAEQAKAGEAEAARKEAVLLGKYQDRAVERYRRAAVTKTGASAKK